MSVSEGKWYLPGSRSPGRRGLVPVLGALVVLAGCVSPGAPDGASPETPSTPTDAPGRSAATTAGNATTGSDPAATTVVPDATLTHAPNVTPGKGDQPDALESGLYGLVVAENRSAYAATRDLRLRNGSVLVVVELHEGKPLPREFDLDVRTTYENLVQAFVPVDDLVPLAEHGNVSFVRTPREAAPGSPSVDSTHPHPCSLNYQTGESSRSASYCS